MLSAFKESNAAVHAVSKTWLGRLLLTSLISLAPLASHGQETVAFSGYEWTIGGPGWELTEHLGRPALRLAGANASLADVDFYNGTISFDVAVSGERGFSSIRWRRQPDFSGENFVIRNHKSEERDVLQYEAFHGFRSSWQIYNHNGYTAAVPVPVDEWLPVRVVVRDRKADIYFNSDTPVIHVSSLEGADLAGVVQLNGALAGAHFSNFRVSLAEPNVLAGESAGLPRPRTNPNAIMRWQLGRAAGTRDDWPSTESFQHYVDSVADWVDAEADASGRVNISEYVPASGLARSEEPFSSAVARASIWSDAPRSVPLRFGYSDHVAIFINGRYLFGGTNRFLPEDRRYQGLVDLNREINVPLQRGTNELTFVLGEEDRFGWGFVTELRSTDGLRLSEPGVTAQP